MQTIRSVLKKGKYWHL